MKYVLLFIIVFVSYVIWDLIERCISGIVQKRKQPLQVSPDVKAPAPEIQKVPDPDLLFPEPPSSGPSPLEKKFAESERMGRLLSEIGFLTVGGQLWEVEISETEVKITVMNENGDGKPHFTTSTMYFGTIGLSDLKSFEEIEAFRTALRRKLGGEYAAFFRTDEQNPDQFRTGVTYKYK